MESYHTILVRKYVAGMTSADEQNEIFEWLDNDSLNWSAFLAIAIVSALKEQVSLSDVEDAMRLPNHSSAQHVQHVKMRLNNLLKILQQR